MKQAKRDTFESEIKFSNKENQQENDQITRN